MIKLQKYLLRQNGWTAEQFKLVYWDGIGGTLDRESHDFWVRVVKMMHNWANVGHQKQRMAESSKHPDAVMQERCPNCEAHEDPCLEVPGRREAISAGAGSQGVLGIFETCEIVAALTFERQGGNKEVCSREGASGGDSAGRPRATDLCSCCGARQDWLGTPAQGAYCKRVEGGTVGLLPGEIPRKQDTNRVLVGYPDHTRAVEGTRSHVEGPQCGVACQS